MPLTDGSICNKCEILPIHRQKYLSSRALETPFRSASCWESQHFALPVRTLIVFSRSFNFKFSTTALRQRPRPDEPTRGQGSGTPWLFSSEHALKLAGKVSNCLQWYLSAIWSRKTLSRSSVSIPWRRVGYSGGFFADSQLIDSLKTCHHFPNRNPPPHGITRCIISPSRGRDVIYMPQEETEVGGKHLTIFFLFGFWIHVCGNKQPGTFATCPRYLRLRGRLALVVPSLLAATHV